MSEELSEPDQIAAGKPAGRGRKLVFWGVIGTAAYAAGIIGYVAFQWHALAAMEPDQLATFLGGVVGPLAFLWLVLGFFQQGEELRYSSEALRLQSEELSHSVEQQRELVSVTNRQLELEIAKRNAETEEAERAARPTFAVTHVRDEHLVGGVTRYKFRITNTGLPVSNVALSYRARSVHEGMLMTGDGIECEFDYADGVKLDVETATLSYRTSRGQWASHGFAFAPYQVGGEDVLRPSY